jgi:HPt (histidine-containing phosphotransfer) domain-containing protein
MASKSIVSKIDLPIDLAHLGTYTQGDKALELELLTMFLPSAQEYIDSMALSQGDSWWKGAHSLKGVALGVGAGELAALAERAEAHGNSSAAVRGDEIAAIQAALERVRCFVADLT